MHIAALKKTTRYNIVPGRIIFWEKFNIFIVSNEKRGTQVSQPAEHARYEGIKKIQ